MHLPNFKATLLWLLAVWYSAQQPVAMGHRAGAPDIDSQQYVEFLGSYNVTHKCVCFSQVGSEYDLVCKISDISAHDFGPSSNYSIPCSDLPTSIIAHLTINCSDCYECVVVNLHEMTRAHYNASQNRTVYPPPEVHLDNCQVNSLNIGSNQLATEQVNVTENMEVAQFGVPERPGVGGYYTVDVKYPDNFSESDCWLTYLRISNANIWFLPSYVMHRCSRLRSVNIDNSPITWVSLYDLLALRSIDSLTLSNCRVTTFANDGVQVALDSLDEYLEHGNSAFQQNNRTLQAVERLRQMRSDSGRLSMLTYLYDMMDTANIRFSLLFGYRSAQETDHTHDTDIPHGVGLSYLNLAYNDLTEIPYSISMFGYLSTINMSHNKIGSLYRSWLCWYPPIPESEKASSTRHCYWFRGSRETLKILDLSYNRIDLIGEIQPWHGVALAELFLHHNRIANLNSDAFSYSLLTTSLLKLFLDSNPLPYFHLSSLNRLEVISISSSDIGNIEPESLPNSKQLTSINLFNNSISAIAPYAFAHLEALDSIDLSHNSMQHFFEDSFMMPSRPTLGSRVVLSIQGQKRRMPVCDCNHVYARILHDESGMPQANYTYPRLSDESKESNCTFFSLSKGTIEIKPLSDSQYQDFVCEFDGDTEHAIPPKYCHHVNDTLCLVTCVRECKCYHSKEWTLANMDCSGSHVDLVRILLQFPMKFINMSNNLGSDYFRRISAGTFKWKSSDLSKELLVLNLHNSSVYYVEDEAFSFQPPLLVLTLHDNYIKTVSVAALCALSATLNELTLHSNSLTWIDPDIFNGTCLPNLRSLSLSNNPWQCSCDPKWLKLHSTLINVSRTTQAILDFSEMQCRINDKTMDACTNNRRSHEGWIECNAVLKNRDNYSINDEENLLNLCRKIEDSEKEQRTLIALSTVGGAFGLILFGLVCLAIRRRHRLLAVVRVLVLLRYQRDRRLRQQVTRDFIRYDAMLWAADRDQDRLVDVLNRVRSISGGEELELCVPQSFLYSSLCSCPLTYFDCPAEGARYSGKVVVALSERFLDTEYLALCQVIRELDSLGRNPFIDIVFLRLSRDVSLRRHRRRRHRGVVGVSGTGGEGPEEVEAFKTLQRILASSDIVYDSVDWEYRLVRRIRSGASGTVAATDESLIGDSGDQGSESEVMRDLPDDEQPLVVNVEPRRELSIHMADWPPFFSDQVAELFIISASSDSDAETHPSAVTKTIIYQIVKRMTGVKLGTCDSALVANWPDSFESTVTPTDKINSFMMKRTRQFVLLLSNRLLNWFRDEAEMQCEFEAFLAANSFRRRLLVILTGQVDNRSRLRYQSLANQRLDDGVSEETPNWCDMTSDGDCERLGSWLDNVLYKRSA